MKSHFSRIDVLDVPLIFDKLADLLSSSQLSFISVKQVYEVAVFDHHRFCDEFSHLVDRSFLASPGL